MADIKKLSELSQTSGLNNEDEFIVVDKSVKTGADASSSGRTSKIRFDDLKDQIGSQGQKGEKGPQGQSITGPQGDKGPQGQSITGPQGDKGPQGQSITGPQGDKGPQGQSITGPEGDKGQKGQKGDFQKGQKGDFQKGDKGQKGDFQKGEKGPQGKTITGPDGQKGQKGQKGQSITGPSGDKGQKGQKGDFQKGQKGDFQKGQKGQKGDFQKGQKGQDGASGSPWGGGTFTGGVTFSKAPTLARGDANAEGGQLNFQTSDAKSVISLDAYDHRKSGNPVVNNDYHNDGFRLFRSSGPRGVKLYQEWWDTHSNLHGNLWVTGNIEAVNQIHDQSQLGKKKAWKFPEVNFGVNDYHLEGYAFVDKTFRVRANGSSLHHRIGYHSGHSYGWYDFPLPDYHVHNEHIEKLYFHRHNIFVITNKGTGYAAGYGGRGNMANDPGSPSKPSKVWRPADMPLNKIQHNKPLKKICLDQYSCHDTWMLDTDGVLWGCGHNSYGIHNDKKGYHSWDDRHTTNLNSSKQLLKVTDNVKDCWLLGWSGHATGFVRKNDDTLWTIGYNPHGELGNGNTTSLSATGLKQVINNQFFREKVKDIWISFDSGAKTIYVITQKNQLWGWGYNGLGQLGLGHTTSVKEPTILFGGKKVNKVYASRGHHTAAYLQDENNFFYACGYNGYGQLGVGDATNRKTWTRVTSLDPIKDGIIQFKCEGGNVHHPAVYFHAHWKGRRVLYVCGYNGVGQLGRGHTSNLNKFERIQHGPWDIRDFHVFFWHHSHDQKLMVIDQNDDLWTCGRQYGYNHDPHGQHDLKLLVRQGRL